MRLDKLLKHKTKKKMRIGRGESSGKGKTATRGAKGQKKRGKVKLGFEGGQLPIYQRLPHKRGLRNKPFTKSISIRTEQLNKLPPDTIIDLAVLKKAGFIDKSIKKIKAKIVLGGKVDKKLKIKIPITKKAKSLIEKVGGQILNEDSA